MKYKPHPGQLAFHQQRLWHLWRALIGGTASGKTEAGAAEGILWAMTYRGSVGAMYEPTYGMVSRNLIPKLNKLLGHPFYENRVYVKSYNKSEGLIEWTSGSQTWLNSLQEPERGEGQNLDWVWIDEARLVPKLGLALQVTARRLRGSGSGSPLGGWITTTPDSPGSVLFNFLEDPRLRNPSSKVYRISILDNPYLPPSYIDEMKRAHTGGFAERFLYGRFAAVAEGAFGFDSTKHVLSVAEKADMRWWVYGVDFGWTNPACILAIGFDGDGRAFVFDEFYKSQASDEELVNAAQEMQETYGPGRVVCDPSDPQTIEKMTRAGLNAEGNRLRREDGDQRHRQQDTGRWETAGTASTSIRGA